VTKDAVPLMDLSAASGPLHDRLREQLSAVLDSGWYLEGEHVAGIEREFATYSSCQHAVAVGNGTDAIELALRSVGVRHGDEVITVANAGAYTTTACAAIGAVPCFADIERESLLLDPDGLGECLAPRTRAVVVTHLYGRMVDVARVRAAVGADVAIIEDCAQAHGALLHGNRAGSQGDAAAFSFYPTKNLGALGDAGMVLTNDASRHSILKQLKQYGWSSRYHISVPHGRNTRMDELQAAVLRIKLPQLDWWNQQRRDIAAAYDAALVGSRFQVYRGNHEGNVHHLYVARHPHRDHVQERLRDRGIATSVHYPVLDCDQPGLRELPMRSSDLKVSRAAVNEILTLPCYPGMSSGLVERVIAAIRDVESV
jgi:aminotransferase EvaB